MKILHIITHYYPHVYGAENFAQHVAEWQALKGDAMNRVSTVGNRSQTNTTNKKEKNEIHVITGRWISEWKKEEVVNGVQVHRVAVIKIRYIQTILAILPLVWKAWLLKKQHGFDVVHTHIYPGMIVGNLLRFIVETYHDTSLRLICTIQGGDIGDYPEVFGPRPVPSFFKKIISWSLKQADTVHCVSTYLRDEVIKMGVNKDKVVVVPNGVDVHKFQVPSSKSQVREKRKKKKQIRFISTSRLEEKNNLLMLVEVMKELRKKGFDVRLDIYGTGSLRQNLESRILNLELQELVKLKGYINHEKLSKILSEYYFFIRLSTQEGFGISFIEAMACGVIPIGTNVGGIVDIIDNGETGYLVKVPSTRNQVPKVVKQMEKIVNDQNNWGRIARNGIEKVEREYDWQKVLPQVEEIYE